MKIGTVKIEHLAILAPMRAVNCPSFRILCKKRGAGLVSTQTFWTWEIEKWQNRVDEEFTGMDGPLSVQVGGNKPGELKHVVELLEPHADIIDFNAGCPHNEECGNKSGAFLLLHLDQLERAVKAVITATNKPVTAKIRTGWSPDKINTAETVKLLEGLGVAAITVHGRTRQQLFKGQADWNQIKLAKELVKVPVIGNGDVFSGPDAEHMMQETGCDAVMIGRAAKGNPAIFHKVNAWIDDHADIQRDLRQAIDDFLEFTNSYHRIEKDRSFTEFRDQATWFLKGFRNIKAYVDQIWSAKSIDEIESIFGKLRNT
nr:tRNA-dihydrouridine synthase family protein [Candidatus Sigynarchaeota archaeon]